jgi:hypothetical protein
LEESSAIGRREIETIASVIRAAFRDGARIREALARGQSGK